MSTKHLLTIVGSTGAQGGSILDIWLARQDLQAKYSLRGITRDPSSAKAKALVEKGIEMVKASLDDIDTLKQAFSGSYGVYGVTDFWATMSKSTEIQQGKNIVDAAKAAGVKHLVLSTLKSVEKLSGGKYKHVDHFDGKAEIEEYAEANKGDMVVSYFMPAMYVSFIKQLIKKVDGTPTMALPYPNDSFAWPMIDARRDVGKFVMGIFEGGKATDGIEVQAPSFWTSPNEVVSTLSKVSGQEVVFKTIPGDLYASWLPEAIRSELTEMQLFIGEYSYYGSGSEKQQADSDKWVLSGEKTISFEEWAKANGPWEFQ